MIGVLSTPVEKGRDLLVLSLPGILALLNEASLNP